MMKKSGPQKKKKGKGTVMGELYDEIATSFNEKRQQPWCEVVQFIKTMPPTAGLILDLGCGNGRHTLALLEHGFKVVAMDLSYKILQIAKTRAKEKKPAKEVMFINGDGRALPVRPEAFEAILMIAVIHHLPTKEERKKMLEGIAAKLTKKGKALISCWLRTHPRFRKEDLREEIAAGKKDVIVPWTMPNGKKVQRYYYLFDPEELEELCEEAGLEKVKGEKANHNFFLTVKKKKEKEGKRTKRGTKVHGARTRFTN